MIREGYHTQEFRSDEEELEKPIMCNAKNAWLGTGYYFWLDLEYARYWGEDFKKDYKKSPGFYSIYKANIDTSNFIDTVFNEEGYNLFKDSIEKAFIELNKQKITITLERVNRFLADKIWPELKVSGIIYDDKPTNPSNKDRIYSEIPNLYYKKRIQMVSFDLANIHNFALYLDEQS